MSEPFLGEIVMFGGNYAPRNWAYCDGQLVLVSDNSALFAILGTTYGGDGRTTFALPDLQGRMPMHPGSGPGLSLRRLGDKSGTETQTLTVQHLPEHGHDLSPTAVHAALGVNSAVASQVSPVGNFPAKANDGESNFASTTSAINQLPVSGTTDNVGGGQPVNNLPPYLCVSFIIAMAGIFPSRS